MPPNQKGTILRVRTFADDVKRAGGETPIHSPVKAHATGRTLEDALLKDVTDVHAREAKAPPPVLETPAQVQKETSASFDIRQASGTGEDETEATIINDRKAGKWSLFGALNTAILSWVTRQRETFAKTAHPDVAPQSRGPKTVLARDAFTVAPRDDHGALFKTLRTEPQTTIAAQPEEVPSWRRVNEPSAHTPPHETHAHETRTFKDDLKRALPARDPLRPPLKSSAPLSPLLGQEKNTIPQGDAIAQAAAHARERLQKLAQEQEAGLRTSRDIPFIPPKMTHEKATPIRTFRTDAVSDVISHDLSKPKIAALELERQARTGVSLSREEKHMPAFILPLFGTLIMLIVFGIGATVLYPRFMQPEIATPTQGISGFFGTATQKPFTLPQERTRLLEEMNSLRLNTPLAENTFLQLYPKETSEPNAPRVPLARFMEILDPRAPGNLLRSLAPEYMIGAHGTDRAPFIILKTTDFTVGFAGMLSWEESMSVDLAPFFGTPVRRSYDPSALTIDQSKPARFVDIVVKNKDVRVLYDEEGKERILYTLNDPETIIITTNTKTLEALLEALN